MPSKSNQNLYDILGIEPTSDDVEIKKAYRRKVLTCHPDKNPNNPKANELFHQITTAYTVLIDPESRKNYDDYLLACNAIRYVSRRMELQIRYNRGCLSPISDMDFQFWAIWAAQGSKGKYQL